MLDVFCHREVAGREHVRHDGVLAKAELVWMKLNHGNCLSQNTDSVRVMEGEGYHLLPSVVGVADLLTSQEASIPQAGLMGKGVGEDEKHRGAALAGRQGSAFV